MTANLLAPIVINGNARCGRQVILNDERYNTRHPILQEMWRSVQTQEAAG
jgi:flagellar assembly factor FliW